LGALGSSGSGSGSTPVVHLGAPITRESLCIYEAKGKSGVFGNGAAVRCRREWVGSPASGRLPPREPPPTCPRRRGLLMKVSVGLELCAPSRLFLGLPNHAFSTAYCLTAELLRRTENKVEGRGSGIFSNTIPKFAWGN
jgi:hypothetical protein